MAVVISTGNKGEAGCITHHQQNIFTVSFEHLFPPIPSSSTSCANSLFMFPFSFKIHTQLFAHSFLRPRSSRFLPIPVYSHSFNKYLLHTYYFLGLFLLLEETAADFTFYHFIRWSNLTWSYRTKPHQSIPLFAAQLQRHHPVSIQLAKDHSKAKSV